MFRLVGYCIIIVPILLLISGIFLWNEKKKGNKYALRKVLGVWGVLVLVVGLYVKCDWFGEFVDMHVFPDRSYEVRCFNEEDEIQKIKLPPNSRWRYRTPDDVYVTKSSLDEIVNFFKEEFKEMKEDEELNEYSYDEEEKIFRAWLTQEKILYIRVYKNHKFSISIKER